MNQTHEQTTKPTPSDLPTFYPFYPQSSVYEYDISDVPKCAYEERKSRLQAVSSRLQKGAILNRYLEENWTLKKCEFCEKKLNSPHQSLMHLWSDTHIKKVYGHLGAVPDSEYEQCLSYLHQLLRIYLKEAGENINGSTSSATSKTSTRTVVEKIPPKISLPLCRTVHPYFSLRAKFAKLELKKLLEEFKRMSDVEVNQLSKMNSRLQRFSPKQCIWCTIPFSSFDSVVKHVFSDEHFEQIWRNRSCTAADIEFWQILIREAKSASSSLEMEPQPQATSETSAVPDQKSFGLVEEKGTEPSKELRSNGTTVKYQEKPLPFTSLRQKAKEGDVIASDVAIREFFDFLDKAKEEKKFKRLLRKQIIAVVEKDCSFCGVSYQIPSVAIAHILTKKHMLRMLGAGHLITKEDIDEVRALLG